MGLNGFLVIFLARFQQIVSGCTLFNMAVDMDLANKIFLSRRFFTKAYDNAIETFSNTWFVEESELHLSAIQYVIGSEPIPNIRGILDSKQFDKYKAVNPDAKPLKYGPEMKRQWIKLLDEVIVPLGDELR